MLYNSKALSAQWRLVTYEGLVLWLITLTDPLTIACTTYRMASVVTEVDLV